MSQTFTYRVRDKSGQVVSGSLEADNSALLVTRLRAMGYTPLAVDRQKAARMKADIRIPGLSGRVKLKEVSVFSRQFATMIASGLTMLRSLSILAEQTENPAFAEIIDQVRVDVEGGSSLSQALAKHPKAFDRLYLSMIRAGESGGTLDDTLKNLATSLEKRVELRAKVRSAMAYPVAVLSLVVLILTAMLLFVIPIFKKMYAQLNGKLPLMTRSLIGFSSIFVKAFPVFVVLAIVGFIVFKKWVATDKGKARWDAFRLRIPVMGGLVRKMAIERFASTLSTLMSSGVSVLEALEITEDAVNNSIVARGVRAVAEGARRGEPLTRPLADHPIFPPMVVQMMAVGEETGALDDLLRRVADFLSEEVSATVGALTSLLEPLLIMVLGSVVGTMVISLYLPMFDIIKQVQNS